MNKKNILTPVDFSLNSIQAFDFAVQYSRKHKAILHLLHVIDPLLNEKISRLNDDFIMMERIRNANEELKKFVNEIPHPGVMIQECLKLGNPAEEILKYSRKNIIDIIIISSHGWTADLNSTTGCVAEKIIEQTVIPVICLRADKLQIHNHDLNGNISLAENWVG